MQQLNQQQCEMVAGGATVLQKVWNALKGAWEWVRSTYDDVTTFEGPGYCFKVTGHISKDSIGITFKGCN